MRVLLFAIVCVGIVSIQSPAGQEPLTLVKAIELPGVEGRFDHMAIDTVGQRLFVAALGNNTVEVLDVKEGLHLKSLPGFREPQGIAFLPDLKLAVVANGQGDGVQIIDADNYRVATSVRLGDDSDNVRYEAGAKRVFVGSRERRAGGGRSRRGQRARPGEAGRPPGIVSAGTVGPSGVRERSQR